MASSGIVNFSPLTTFQLFRSIFQQYGFRLDDISEKGQYAAAIEETMGGRFGEARLLRDEAVRELLSTLAKLKTEASVPLRVLHKIVGKSTSKSGRGEHLDASKIIDALNKAKVIRPGLEFKCQYCYKRAWYHVSEFSEEFVCRYCFHKQPARILGLEWRYRPSGLFATRDVGHGSMTVIATSLFFRSRSSGSEQKQIYSCNLWNQNKVQREVDLAILDIGHDGDFQIAICECKTTDFYDLDFERLKEIVEKIPQAVACIATFKDDFSDKEKELVNNFWKQGLPVIMLTEKELGTGKLDTQGLPESLRFPSTLAQLAYATQHLYLIPNHQ